MLFFILAFAFLAGALLALAAGNLLGAERRTLAARLAALPRRQSDARRSLAEEQLEGGWQERFWIPLRARLAAWGLRLTPAGSSVRLRASLARAGHPKFGVGEFAGLRVLGGALGVTFGLTLRVYFKTCNRVVMLK